MKIAYNFYFSVLRIEYEDLLIIKTSYSIFWQPERELKFQFLLISALETIYKYQFKMCLSMRSSV